MSAKPTILIYDDEAALLEMLKRMLNRQGFPTIEFSTAAAAEAEAMANNYALCIFDGSGGGWEAANRIQAAGKNVVIFTGRAEPPLGFDNYVDFFEKPGQGRKSVQAMIEHKGLTW